MNHGEESQSTLHNPEPTEEQLQIRHIVKDEIFRMQQQSDESDQEEVEEIDYGLYFAYWNRLSESHQAGHKVDNELKEIIQIMRESLGIEDIAEKYKKDVQTEAKSIARGLAYEYINTLKRQDILTISQAEKATNEIWNLR